MSTSSPPAAAAPSLGRRIAGIAVPALGSLIAEPLYLLVDTAIVGHLGRHQLAALGIATQALLTIVSLCVFLAYGTTTQVARAGDDRQRALLGVQGLWLGAAVGGAVLVLLLALGGPIAHAIGGPGDASDLAARYLRLSAPGVAAQLIALAGQGWLRGREALGLALRLVVAAQVINIVAEVVFVYGLHLGLDGSALGTVVAQVSLAAATVWLVLRAARRTGAPLAPHAAILARLSRFGGLLLARSAALSGSYLVVSGAAAHISEASIGAHQVGTQLLWLGALALDALAIAAQVLVAAALGAGDHAAARAAAVRLTIVSCGCGLLVAAILYAAGPTLVTSIFTGDHAVQAAARQLWPWLCGIQILGGFVFALDGILIGAEDSRVLAIAMVGAAAALAVALLVIGTSTLGGLWAALVVMFVGRGALLGLRALRGPLQATPGRDVPVVQ
ncbi:MAG: MATE family efflux transporter [Solirubrobacteraceae bacterium]|nr:MATE family efflux transporter [Patulibacter sp.]